VEDYKYFGDLESYRLEQRRGAGKKGFCQTKVKDPRSLHISFWSCSLAGESFQFRYEDSELELEGPTKTMLSTVYCMEG